MARSDGSTYITVWMPRALRDALRRVAQDEANSEAAVARRLIKRGLAAERPQPAQEPRTPEDAA